MYLAFPTKNEIINLLMHIIKSITYPVIFQQEIAVVWCLVTRKIFMYLYFINK